MPSVQVVAYEDKAKIQQYVQDANDMVKTLEAKDLERGEELNQKQQAGVELADKEIKDFEGAREALMSNEIASEFMEAQQNLQTLQKTISKYVGMTLELGRVPEAKDMEEADGGGCCGGGCGC